MNIRSFAKQVSMWQLLRLTGLMLLKPLYIIPTLRATKRTMAICNSLYEKEHHSNRKANAFRHALWNVLICQNIFKMTKNEEKSMIWARKVTNLHEKLAPNAPLAMAMDLHNNEVGRMYLGSLKNSSEEEIITFLQENTQKAKKVLEIKAILDHKNDLVYLSEDK